jgi:hypothetical protein
MLRWILAFVDRPAGAFDAAAGFWAAATDTRLSARRGPDAEFATFLPADGDACLKLQGVRDGGGAHLDLEFDDPVDAVAAAEALGASVVAHHGDWAVTASPTGQLFCVLPWSGATRRPAAVSHNSRAVSRVDQVCLDIAPESFEAETAFWGALAGGTARPGKFAEFAWLDVPHELPIRLLFQRLDQGRGATTAHIDLACSDPQAVREVHEELGAEFVGQGASWLVMRDPAGGIYCLTGRDPHTGRLPAAG